MDDRKSVLIVEDDLILNLLYESYFERLGFETEGELVHAEAAVELTKKLDPDLIVMDIALEGELTGIDAIKQIREFSNAPVIYITEILTINIWNRQKQLIIPTF
jgi:CheY-like chemotaxis protein